MKKRIIASVLVLVLALFCLPFTAFAEGAAKKTKNTSDLSYEADDFALYGTDEEYSIVPCNAGNSCVDDGGTAIHLWKTHRKNNQIWTLGKVGDYYYIKSKSNGKVIDVPESKAENGRKLHCYSYNGGDNQLWRLESMGNGTYCIHSKLKDSFVWDVWGASWDNVSGLYTMGDIARASTDPFTEELLYKIFGVNAELLIDHAWGWEPTTIEHIKQYRPCTNSLSSGQVLKEPYPYEKCRLIVREMTELLVQDLVRKKLVTKQITLTIIYDKESLKAESPGGTIRDTVYTVAKTGRVYTGRVTADPYGRPHPGHSHGTINSEKYTNSARRIIAAAAELYERITDPDLLIRKVYIAACGLIYESMIPQDLPEQLDLFTDYEMIEKQRIEEKKKDEKERNMIRAILDLQKKFGKNTVLKGMNFFEGGTTIERNGQIGGHKA